MSLGKRKRPSSFHEENVSIFQGLGSCPMERSTSQSQPSSIHWHSPPLDKGFGKLPPELTLEILSYFQSVEHHTRIPEGIRKAPKRPHPASILSLSYLERSDTLRALCATCTAYRSIFHPLLWERLEICFPSRSDEDMPFHRAVGEAMIRKCEGLLQNQDLATMVRTVNVVFTRHNMEATLPAFARCLRLMPNLYTIHVLDANPQMPNAIKTAFKNVFLPSVRTLIIPGTCHEILRHCPEAERVFCIQGTGNKLVTVIGTFCKKVTEVKGFRCEEDASSMKRLVKSIPNLRVIEINAPCPEGALDCLLTLKQLSRVDLHLPRQNADLEDERIQRTVRKLHSLLREGPGVQEKRLRLVHPSSFNLTTAKANSDLKSR